MRLCFGWFPLYIPVCDRRLRSWKTQLLVVVFVDRFMFPGSSLPPAFCEHENCIRSAFENQGVRAAAAVTTRRKEGFPSGGVVNGKCMSRCVLEIIDFSITS